MTSLPRCSPSTAGLDPRAVEAFLDALAADGIEMHGLMIARGDAVVAEGWWAPYSPRRRNLVYSLSKSFTSFAAGIAAAEGAFGLDDPVLDHLGEFAPADVDERFRRLTIAHCLRMATGHEVDMLDACRTRAGEQTDPELLRAFFTLPPEREPGTLFAYNQLATYVVARIVEKHAGTRLVEYVGARLLTPLGVERSGAGGYGWLEHDGHTLGFSGLHVPTEAVLRLGLLALHSGRFGGAQVVPADYVAAATGLRQRNDPPEFAMPFDEPGAPDWEAGYGYQFWMSRHGFRGDGAFGQFCLVWPDEDAVVAITSRTEEMSRVMDHAFAHLRPGFGPAPDGPEAREAPDAAAPAGGAGGEAGADAPTTSTAPSAPTEAPTAEAAGGGLAGAGDDARLAQRLLRLALPLPDDAGDPRGEGAGPLTPTRVEGPLDGLSALTLTPADGGWSLDLAYAQGTVTLPIGRGAWAEGAWATDAGAVPFVSAGGWTPDGRHVCHLRMIETPHLLVVTHDPAADAASVAWSELPLHGADPAGFVVPSA